MEQYKIKNMYTLSESIAGDFLKKFEFPWDAVPAIGDCITALIKEIDKNSFKEISEEFDMDNPRIVESLDKVYYYMVGALRI